MLLSAAQVKAVRKAVVGASSLDAAVPESAFKLFVIIFGFRNPMHDATPNERRNLSPTFVSQSVAA